MSIDDETSGEQPGKKTAPLNEVAVKASRPEFFRLPKSGGDPYFGFGRSYYYEGEQRGYWRLVRIRGRGKLRGVTLVPYDAISAFVRKRMVDSEKETA
ncbi:MAG: hypothetical protein ACREIF_02125 [Chthoniobacterales bacterium]